MDENTVIFYDEENDVYVKVWGVDAWEKRFIEVDAAGTVFPDAIDIAVEIPDDGKASAGKVGAGIWAEP